VEVAVEPEALTGHRRRIGVARWLLGLAVGVGSVWVAITVTGGFADAGDALGRLSVPWLLAALAVEALSYGVLGVKLRQLVGPELVGNRESVELGLVLSGFGPLTPASPAEGLALVSTHLRHRGVTNRQITTALALSQWFSMRVFLLASALNLLVVVAIERDPLSDLWPFALAAIGVIGLLAITARLAATPSATVRASTIAGAFRRPSRRRPVEERRAAGERWHREARQLVGSPKHRAFLASLTATALLGDIACLWFALRAGGANVGFDVALLAVTVSSVATLVPLVPGGLGIVEAAIPAVTHHFGVPYDQGLAAALVYRALGTFVPAGVGVVAVFTLRTHLAPTSGGTAPGRSA
jgi:uncharacterized protein (TIRG00374 family)